MLLNNIARGLRGATGLCFQIIIELPSEFAPLAYFCIPGLRVILCGSQPCPFFGLMQGFYVWHLTHDFYVAKAAADKLFDEMRLVLAEDGCLHTPNR